jgi:hypothetical protein
MITLKLFLRAFQQKMMITFAPHDSILSHMITFAPHDNILSHMITFAPHDKMGSDLSVHY